MKFQGQMIFLGMTQQTSKKTGNAYSLAKFMYANKENTEQQIFEMYVPSDKLTLTTDLAKLTMFTPVCVTMKMSSFNGKAQVDLEKVEQ